MVEFFQNFWTWLTTDIPVAPVWILLIVFILAFAASCTPQVFFKLRLFSTYIHEAGHAIFAMLTGRRVDSIKLGSNSGGATAHTGTANWFSRFITAFAGYPAPALASFGIVAAVAVGHPRWVLVGFGVLGLLLLFVQHSWRGLFITVLIGLGVWLISLIGNEIASVLLIIVAGYLAAASPMDVLNLRRGRLQNSHKDIHGEDTHSDADTLASLSLFPAVFWEIIFMLTSVALIILSILKLYHVV